MLSRMRLVSALVGTVLALASTSDAGSTAGKWQQALMYNGVPVPLIDTPGYTTPKCLLPYPLCKVMWASISVVAAAEQVVMGGDVQGARDSLSRGFGGEWILRPRNVSGDWLWSVPLPPVTMAAALLTGGSNAGEVAIDPFPARPREEPEDVLHPEGSTSSRRPSPT